MNATMTIFKQLMPCQMDDTEYAAISKDLVEWLNDIARREAEALEIKERNKIPLKQAVDEVRNLRETLNTRTIAKEIECARVFNWDTKNTHVIRLDTNQMVPGSVRKMSDEELQTDCTQEDAPKSFVVLAIESKVEVEPTIDDEDCENNSITDADFDVVEDVDSDTPINDDTPPLDFDDSDQFPEENEDMEYN